MMKSIVSLIVCFGFFHTIALGSSTNNIFSEVVYVESPTDTDNDGKPDLIYVKISRPYGKQKISAMYHISPYAEGGNRTPMHSVDMDYLPQDEDEKDEKRNDLSSFLKKGHHVFSMLDGNRYAKLVAHSVGTGKSKGCPTVGDMNETLAAKSVIDWLGGRAKAYNEKGNEVKADWSNGKVGMTGVSYNGTLPIMVAATGVPELKAIVPIAAISSWYDYYRSNGLVVNPGGYIGEDADILGYYIVKSLSRCRKKIEDITRDMGREHGDFTPFWQKRDYLPLAKNFKAATFLVHGQNDWNVKQKHPIQLWHAIEGVVPRKMFLHRKGHGSTWSHGLPQKIQDWFDHYLEGVDNGIEKDSKVHVELPSGELIAQKSWPNEQTEKRRLFFQKNGTLSREFLEKNVYQMVDQGERKKITSLMRSPSQRNRDRAIYQTAPFSSATILSGTPQVSLTIKLLNRRAANLTVAIIEYTKRGEAKLVTRGWADPQNHMDIAQGELLQIGKEYPVSFQLEPKQYRFSKGSRLGVLISLTDFNYTLRPKAGTEVSFLFNEESFIDLHLSN